MSGQTAEKMYILYDLRALSGDTDDASIVDTAHSMDEIAEANNTNRATGRGSDGVNGVWYEYDVQGDKLVNPVERMDLFNWGLKPLKKRRKRRKR